jgi:hypothetical protein
MKGPRWLPIPDLDERMGSGIGAASLAHPSGQTGLCTIATNFGLSCMERTAAYPTSRPKNGGEGTTFAPRGRRPRRRRCVGPLCVQSGPRHASLEDSARIERFIRTELVPGNGDAPRAKWDGSFHDRVCASRSTRKLIRGLCVVPDPSEQTPVEGVCFARRDVERST